MATIELTALLNALGPATAPDVDDVIPVVEDGTLKAATTSQLDVEVFTTGMAAASTAQAKAGTSNVVAMTPASAAAAQPFVVVHPSGDTTGATDRAAINAALAASTVVRLAAGTFYVNATVTLATGRHLQGAGRDHTTIYLASSANPTAIIDYASGGLANVTVSDLTVDGNKAGNTSGIGVRFPVFTDSTLERVRIENTADIGFHSYQGADVEVRDCVLTGIGSANTEDGSNAGILVQETDGAKIIGNRVAGCTDTGILAPTVGHTVISDNVVDDCYFIGIGLGGGHTATDGNYTITGNTLRNVDGNPIDTGDACNVTVTGNSLSDSATGSSNVTAGICVDISAAAAGILNVTIANNTLQNISKVGIQIVGHQTSGHSQFTIANNTMTGLGQHGIQLSAMDYGTVVGNTIRNCGNGFAFVHLDQGTGAHGCSHNTIVGNTFDDPDTNSYAIHSTHATNDYNTIANNDMSNCWAKAVGTFGSNTGEAIVGVALSDETTTITNTGNPKATIRAPYAFALLSVRATLSTVSSSGVVTVDVNDGGTTMLSTKLTVDASEKTSTTAATPAVLSDTTIANDAELTFDIDTAGTGAKGLKVWLYGFRT
jgi:parallel beta-helix repeat protein